MVTIRLHKRERYVSKSGLFDFFVPFCADLLVAEEDICLNSKQATQSTFEIYMNLTIACFQSDVSRMVYKALDEVGLRLDISPNDSEVIVGKLISSSVRMSLGSITSVDGNPFIHGKGITDNLKWLGDA